MMIRDDINACRDEVHCRCWMAAHSMRGPASLVMTDTMVAGRALKLVALAYRAPSETGAPELTK